MKRSYVLLLPLLLASHALAEKQYVLEEETTVIRGDEEPLQWTPHAVTVIKDEEIGVTYRHDLEDLQGLAPGLIVDSLSGTPQGAAISIRGVGTSDVNNGFFEPGVAVKVDGVYVGTHASQMQVLFDFEQVEVARGPQGTLEGAPNLGGTVHLKRRKPTGSFDIDLRTSFGENNRKEFDVAVNFPITESIAGKITHTAKRNGGDYINNITIDRRENEEDRSASAIALLATFGGNLTAHYIYDTEDDDSDTPALLNISTSRDQLCIQSGTSEETCGFAEEVPQTKSKVLTAQNFSNERQYEGDYHTLNLNFDFEGYKVSSITGTRKTEELSNIDWDASHVDFYSATREQTYKQFSQEITLHKQHNEKLAYSFGFYYLDFDYTLFQEEFHVLRALHNAGLACCFSADDVLRTNSKQSGDLQSAFVHGTYQINEQWIADAGVRFSKFDKTLSHQPRGWRYGDIILESKRDFSGNQTTKETTPTLGLSYKVDDEAMIYLRYTTGYLPGAYDENALSLDTAQPTEAQTAES